MSNLTEWLEIALKDIETLPPELLLAPAAERPVLNVAAQDGMAIAEVMESFLHREGAATMTGAFTQGAQGVAGPGIRPEDPETTTLPIPATKGLALPEAFKIKAYPVRSLPGYVFNAVRDLGGNIFRSFPCFQAFEKACKGQGRDGLGDVLTVSTLLRDGAADVDRLADLIRKHGQAVSFGYTDVSAFIPHYKPETILFATEKLTFLLVRDSLENGAPINANYIYAWPGGKAFYGATPLPAAKPTPRRLGQSDSPNP